MSFWTLTVAIIGLLVGSISYPGVAHASCEEPMWFCGENSLGLLMSRKEWKDTACFANARVSTDQCFYLASHDYFYGGCDHSYPLGEFMNSIKCGPNTNVIFMETCNGHFFASDIARCKNIPVIAAKGTLVLSVKDARKKVSGCSGSLIVNGKGGSYTVVGPPCRGGMKVFEANEAFVMCLPDGTERPMSFCEVEGLFDGSVSYKKKKMTFESLRGVFALTPPRPVTGCTTPRLSGSSRITSTYSQWLNSSASQCSAGQGLRGAQCASNLVQMMNPYLAPCVDTFQNEVLTGIDELDPTESKFFSNSVCQMTGGIGLGYGLGAAASTCAEFGGVTNTICLSVGATELGAPLAAVGGTAVCTGACVYVAGHGAVNCYNHSPSQGYAPECGYSSWGVTGYIDNACDLYGDLLPEGPPCDDYAKSNFIEEVLSSIPSSGPVRPVCREKRDPITGRMGVDCRR